MFAPQCLELPDRGGQRLIVAINHQYRKKLRGLGLARITAHAVKGTRFLEEAFTGVIDLLGIPDVTPRHSP
jgi:hypothetical protein